VATDKWIELYSIDTSFLEVKLECKILNIKLPEDQSITTMLPITVSSTLEHAFIHVNTETKTNEDVSEKS
jgi:hypothetical protein